MLKKRLIGVVTVKNGWAVQSFGYHRYLPLGKPVCLVENLDRWGADEILVQVIDRSVAGVGPDYELLDKLALLGLGTPLIYGGGIRTVEDGTRVIQSGADRIAIDSILHEDESMVSDLSGELGAQAIIASIPMEIGPSGAEWVNYKTKGQASIGKGLAEVIVQGFVSEVMVTDWKHEGTPNAFDCDLIDLFPFKEVPLIAFGGISSVEQMRELFARPNITAISVGNFLSYREHAIQIYKEMLASAMLRSSTYATEYSLQANV